MRPVQRRPPTSPSSPSKSHGDRDVTQHAAAPPTADPSVTTIKAAVRIRPFLASEVPSQSLQQQQQQQQQQRDGDGDTDARTASSSNATSSAPREMIRVVTAAGRQRRLLAEPCAIEVLQPPPPSSTRGSAPSATSNAGRSSKTPGILPSTSLPPTKATAYAFDYCAGPQTTQEELFTLLEMPSLCEAALAGQVVTVFCFGQTGSGKTYTLSGRTLFADEEAGADAGATSTAETKPDVSGDGLQYQAVHYLARRLRGMRHDAKRHFTAPQGEKMASTTATAATLGPPSVVAKCSYVELYQETLYDLLQADSAAPLRCRWSVDSDCFYVEGSLLVECHSHKDFLMVLQEGQRNRQRGSHALNRDSSRSHVVFTIFFEVSEGEEGVGEEEDATDAASCDRAVRRRYGRLVFVDLAGSERLKKTHSTSAAESGSINKSLFTLGHVLELLSAPAATARASTETNAGTLSRQGEERGKTKGKTALFIPYRSSVLTQLLMQSLDGHGRTLMVACVSPSLLHLDESLRTIHYAERARHIATTPVTRVDAVTRRRLTLEKQVSALKSQNAMLRQALELPVEGALSREEVETQLERLRRAWSAGADTHTNRRAPSFADNALTVTPPVQLPLPVPPRGRAVSSPVLRTASFTAAVSKATPQRALAMQRQAGGQKASATASSVSSSAAPTSPVLPSLSVKAKEGGAVSILSLLDALPDTGPAPT